MTGSLSMRVRLLVCLLLIVFLAVAARDVRAADCNLNGADDAADIAGGVSEDCNADGVPDECEGMLLRLGRRGQTIEVANRPRDVITADFDGDGELDIAAGVLGSRSASVLVYRGRGGGEFAPPETYPSGARLVGIAASDVDGDGAVDIALVDTARLVVRWNAGDGSLEESTEIDTGGGTVTFAPIDLDGDGIDEIVTTNQSGNEVVIFAHSGGRTLVSAGRHPVGTFPTAVAGGDLDGDGNVDLLTCNWRASSISILRGLGGGEFAPSVEQVLSVTDARNFVVDDFTGNGFPDVAVPGRQGLVVLHNDGAGRLIEVQTLALTQLFIASADLDGDADPDLIVASAGEKKFSVIDNDGDGVFRARLEFGAGVTTRDLAVGDLDGDGDLDLVGAADNPESLPIFWNGEENSIAIEQTTLRIVEPPHAITMGDLDGDGDLDVATANGLSATISIILNDGEGNLRLKQHVRANHGNERVYLNTITSGDLDGDGDLDLLTARRDAGDIRVLRNDGNAEFTRDEIDGRLRTGRFAFHVAAADLDGDTRSDLLCVNQASNTISVFLDDDDRSLQTGTQYRVPSQPTSVTSGDVDGDGDEDVIVSSLSGQSVTVFPNDGSGVLGRSTAIRLGQSAAFVVVGDWDRDGHRDLATANNPNRTISVLRGRGDGTFEEPRRFGVGDYPYSLTVIDLDGDGFDDLLACTNEAPGGNDLRTVTLMLNDGAGGFFASARFTVGVQPRYSAAGDLDGDGDKDFVVANHISDDLTIHLNRTPLRTDVDYLSEICTPEDFRKLSLRSRSPPIDRTLKYSVPARDDAGLLGVVYQNSWRYSLHENFLRSVFPDRFAALTKEEYDRITGLRATREYYVGVIARIRTRDGIVYGFSIVADLRDPEEALRLDEVRRVYDLLRGTFSAGPLAYRPLDDIEKRAAEQWVDPGFDIIDVDTSGIAFQAYTLGVGFGRVRLMDEAQFNRANERGLFTFQDLLVLDHAPRDIEGVVGGIITGKIQNELSHIAVRTSRRGTPNAFVTNAHEVFAEWEGRLARLEVTLDGYAIAPATSAQAESFWAESRPRLDDLPIADEAYGRLDSLLEMDLTGTPEARYGGKATNFARLQRLLTGELERYREDGFAIPVRHSIEFMRSNTTDSFVERGRRVTFEEYIAELLASEEFQTDSELRFLALEELRDRIEDDGVVSAALSRSVALRVATVFGDTTLPVRHRSSSNVEDLLEFNGAGLYESTSACAADELDLDDRGPSRCGGNTDERDIARALRRVWGSLWTFRAFEERSFYQIPHQSAAMGVLVTRAFPDELANGVAFTGNPANPLDRRYMIVVQAGEASVVSPEPGVISERVFLEMDVDGTVLHVFRDRASSLVPEGGPVMTDEKYRELGALMWHIDRNFPVDPGKHEREAVLLDFEFKIEADGELAIKQVRPFLISAPLPPAPTFALVVPRDTTACAVFNDTLAARSPREEYEAKSTVELVSGTFDLPTRSTAFTIDLVRQVRLGPDATALDPSGPGVMRVTRVPDVNDREFTDYSFRFEQEFAAPGGETFVLQFSDSFRARGEELIDGAHIVDDEYLTNRLAMRAELGGVTVAEYSSCGYSLLPLWEVEAGLDDGTALRLRERFLPSENLASTGPAALVRGEVTFPGGVTHAVSSYWRLVYAARRHNLNVRYWIVLDPPVDVAGVERPVRVVEYVPPELLLDVPEEPEASYLDADLNVIKRLEVVSQSKVTIDDPRFVRGDVLGDGAINLSDAIQLLDYLFRGGATPPCLDAADANDDGAVNLSDPVGILAHLFQGAGDLPGPSGECGEDPTPGDRLECASFPACD